MRPPKTVPINRIDPSETQYSNFSVFGNYPLSLFGKVKILFGLFTIFPLRIFLLCMLQITILPVVAVTVYFMPRSVIKKNFLRVLLKIWGRTLLFLMGYIYIRKRTKRKKKEPPVFVVVSNHVSWVDSLFLIQEFGCTFVAKAGVKKIFIIGKLLEEMGAIFVYNRMKVEQNIQVNGKKMESGDKQDSTSSRIIQRLIDPDAEKLPPLCVFPEGTTSNGRHLIHFHKGAFLAGVPVIPVAIRYPFVTFDPAYSSVGLGYSMCCTLCQFISFMEVTFLPPYVPNAEEKSDAALFAENVKKEISSVLKIPMVEKTYADKHNFLVEIGFYQKQSEKHSRL